MKKTLRHLMWAAAGMSISFAAVAHDYTAGSISVGHPYARATVAGQPVGGGYLTLVNKGQAADKLLSVSADVSESVELHSMTMEGDVARMRQIDAIELAPGQSVELKPGGLHVMFLKLKAPLKAGKPFPAVLKFEKAGEVKVEFHVEDASTKVAPHKH